MYPKGVYSGQQVAQCMTLKVPGLDKKFDIQFPKGRLPVCDKCKKNYKTRELCRSRDRHKDLPWAKTFICITIDQSCTDNTNKFVNEPFVARPLDKQPFAYKSDLDTTLPICATCKEKNYTRTYCRSKMKHRYLPWNTVYAALSADPNGKFNNGGGRTSQGASTEYPDKKGVAQSLEDGDDINQIDKSRTFLVSVSSKSCKINWLDFDENYSETLQKQAKYMSSTSNGQDYLQNFNFPSDQHFATVQVQQQNNFVQHVPTQNLAISHPTGHWPNQTPLYNQTRYWNDRQFQFQQEMCLPPTPINQGHLQMQQNVRHCYPAQGQAGTYINGGVDCHVEATYPRMSDHVPTSQVDSFHLNKVEENKNFMKNTELNTLWNDNINEGLSGNLQCYPDTDNMKGAPTIY